MKKFIITLLMALSMFSVTAQASTKISNINLKIEEDLDEDERFSLNDLDITTRSNHYSVQGYDIIVDIDDMEVDDDGNDTSLGGPGYVDGMTVSSSTSKSGSSDELPEIEITLTADDDYYFASMNKSDISISGYGANCTKASRQDSGATLVLTVKLTGAATDVGTVKNAGWSDNTIASWTAAANATIYRIQLYRDGAAVGKNIETSAKTYNFAPLMTKAGTYSYTVRGIDNNDQIGKKTDSETMSISSVIAAANKEKYAVQYEEAEAGAGPDVERKALNAGWQNENGHKWYRTNNGTFPQSSWYEIDGNWYFFDENGYMVSDSWVQWKGKEYYVDSNGIMLANTTAPDGSKLDETGAKQ